MTVKGIAWIASYPKSGNTWVRLLLANLIAGDAPLDLRAPGRIAPNSAALRWIEQTLDVPVHDMTAAEQARLRPHAHRRHAQTASAPRLVKVHDRYDQALFPADASACAIYIARDPRDVAPSWADHMNVSLDEAIARMCRPGFALSASDRDFRDQAPQVFGSWSEHVDSWLGVADFPVLRVTYEDLVRNAGSELARIASFLGLDAEPEAIVRAAAACRFDALRAAEEAQGFVERRRHQARFFRSGKAGGWREVLGADQAAALTEAHGAAMARLGYASGE